MLKILLIVYIVGGGSQTDYGFNTQFIFKDFANMEDCESAVTVMKTMADKWKFVDKKTIPAHYSTKCVPVNSLSQQAGVLPDLEAEVSTSSPALVDNTPPQKRWND